MKIVIDIPEEHLDTLKKLSGLGYYHEVIAKGQPLSEVLDKIAEEINDTVYSTAHLVDISEAIPIIEKYKAESEADFPQAKDIEPTVESFKRTMDNIEKIMP